MKYYAAIKRMKISELICGNLQNILSSDKKQSVKECSLYALLYKKDEEIETCMYIFLIFAKRK